MPPSSPSTHRRTPPKAPSGCTDHVTRQQAAQLLGFGSEFKVRQLERQGRLRSVRGPMHTAFYARADVLALKAELGRAGGTRAASWTDAELLVLLQQPTPEGRPRTALDLVLETHVAIERAEQVFAFWSRSRESAAGASATPPNQPEGGSPPGSGGVCAGGGSGTTAGGERRAGARLSRDALIAALRHPDPRVRDRAFAALKEGSSTDRAPAPRAASS